MMGSGATSTVVISSATSTAMSMASSTSSTAMDMTSSSSPSSSSSSMSSMAMYLTTNYQNVPVVFKTLYATNKSTCFAIFVILFFSAFAFRGISFLSSYIEQKIFREGSVSHIVSQIEKDFEKKGGSGGIQLEGSSLASSIDDLEISGLRKHRSNTIDSDKYRSPLSQFFHFTPQSIYQDFIRLIITFVQVLIAYGLMLSVMTCVIPYLFAVILGVSFGQVFFDRLSVCMDMIPAGMEGSLH
ncbi:hypothetical protein WICPIJ_009637 [Wickerhamomyces pijperi]|uniref:Copper transport protein n=1 Tax=Wickerhamomyces pijperi TaxID=599730 RepID=A0A9P8TDG0_WICPI|nr:hypothetical protein WICPIJ_009637 [Wickerhamomyces pijperi]